MQNSTFALLAMAVFALLPSAFTFMLAPTPLGKLLCMLHLGVPALKSGRFCCSSSPRHYKFQVRCSRCSVSFHVFSLATASDSISFDFRHWIRVTVLWGSQRTHCCFEDERS